MLSTPNTNFRLTNPTPNTTQANPTSKLVVIISAGDANNAHFHVVGDRAVITLHRTVNDRPALEDKEYDKTEMREAITALGVSESWVVAGEGLVLAFALGYNDVSWCYLTLTREDGAVLTRVALPLDYILSRLA